MSMHTDEQREAVSSAKCLYVFICIDEHADTVTTACTYTYFHAMKEQGERGKERGVGRREEEVRMREVGRDEERKLNRERKRGIGR